MELLRKQKEELGSVDLSRIKDWKLVERVARALLRDAGLDISNKRQVRLFLFMVALHLHGKFNSGTGSRKIQIGNLELLKRACASFKAGERETTTAISHKLHEGIDLKTVHLNTVRTQLRRIVVQAVEKQKVRGVPPDELAALMPTLRKIKVERRPNSLAARR
jgi:hypothetical protein